MQRAHIYEHMTGAHFLWTTDPNRFFETHWLRSLFGDLPEAMIDWDAPVVPNAVIIFNHSIDYKSLFAQYAAANVPYIAVHLSDETLVDDFMFYYDPQCLFVVRTYVHPLVFDHPKVLTIGLGYKADFVSAIPYPSSRTDAYYNWSFAGNMHDHTRTHAIEMFRNLVPYKLHLTHSGFNSADGLNIRQYRALIQDSRCVLCLVGQGNIDTFRFYEVLEAGSIPVTLTHTALQPVMPTYWHSVFKGVLQPDERLPFIACASWEQCAEQMRHLLQNKTTYESTRLRCSQLWHRTKEHWRSVIKQALATFSQPQDGASSLPPSARQ